MHAGDTFAAYLTEPEVMPEEDPDGEYHLSIPLARVPALGKPSAQHAIRVDFDEDDDDDCRILDVIDARPINFALQVVPAPAASTKRADTRKRDASETAHAGTSGIVAKKAKTGKRPGDKAIRQRRGPPTATTR